SRVPGCHPAAPGCGVARRAAGGRGGTGTRGPCPGNLPAGLRGVRFLPRRERPGMAPGGLPQSRTGAGACAAAAAGRGRPARPTPDTLPYSRPEGGEGAADVAEVVLADLEIEEVSRCLALLPEPQRVCIVLMDVAGYTAREAAETLGCPRGTVLARVHRGRR